jgi:hypothetical protein
LYVTPDAVRVSQALFEARWPLVARMDADDVCLPVRLRAQLEYMEANAGCDVVGGGAVVVAAALEEDLHEALGRWVLSCAYLGAPILCRYSGESALSRDGVEQLSGHAA